MDLSIYFAKRISAEGAYFFAEVLFFAEGLSHEVLSREGPTSFEPIYFQKKCLQTIFLYLAKFFFT